MLRPPVGISDFCALRRAGLAYVDKTAFVADVLDDPAQVVLFTRPHRFGKTLTQSTLHAFLTLPAAARADDTRTLFAGLTIEGRAEAWHHFQRYPVVSLSFKDVKQLSMGAAIDKVKELIADAYRQHWKDVQRVATAPGDPERVRALMTGTATTAALEGSLLALTRYLHAAHGERCVVLLDEYDTPLHAASSHGYYDELVGFLRNLLSAALKDNASLFKGVLTGILRIAQEGMFSGLNNVQAYSLLDERYGGAFGFTEGEVAALLGADASLAEVRAWYDGYEGPGVRLYNPWSVMSYCHASPRVPEPYWVFTGADDVLRTWLLERGGGHVPELSTLLAGGTLRRTVDTHLALRDVHERPGAVWSLLVFSGYLTARSVEKQAGGWDADLVVPNREVMVAFERSVVHWAGSGDARGDRLASLTRAMLSGDVATFERLLSELVIRTLSFHDLAGAGPERVYQAFVLGALVHLGETHEVTSNREAGLGRVDVLVAPRSPGRAAVVLELKRAEPDNVDAALAEAADQILSRRYAEAALARGASHVLGYAVAFDGKRVAVRSANVQ